MFQIETRSSFLFRKISICLKLVGMRVKKNLLFSGRALAFLFLFSSQAWSQLPNPQEVYRQAFEACQLENRICTQEVSDVGLPETQQVGEFLSGGQNCSLTLEAEEVCVERAREAERSYVDSLPPQYRNALGTNNSKESGRSLTSPTNSRTPSASPSGEAGAANPSSPSSDENGNPGGESPSSGYTSQDLQQDVQQCDSNLSEAVKCCNDPTQCGASSSGSSVMPPATDSQSLKNYCAQMKNASNSGRSSNAEAAGICYTHHSTCSKSCEDSKKKWQDHLPSCKSPSCDPSKVQQALSLFQERTKNCEKLSEMERVLARQSNSNFQDAQDSKKCEEQAAQSEEDQQQQDQGNSAETASTGPDCSGENATKSECVDCSKYPNSPLCMNQQQNSNAYNEDSSGGGLSNSNEKGIELNDFNVGGGVDGLPQFPSFESVAAEPAQGKAIPNGGGGVPGGGAAGGGSGFEGMGGDGSGGGASGYKTDVLAGERGGGGYSGNSSMEPSGGGGFGGYGSGGGEFKNRFSGLDLKQYLPGGKKDPKRGLASANLNSGHPEISPVGVSIFKKISERYDAKCKLKMLMSCE